MNNYTEEIAQTTTNSQILTDILRKGKDDIVSCNAAYNPNCPPEALAEVLKRGNDDWVSRNAAKNPNCPPELLAEILRREKNDDVSWTTAYSAASNPSCPPEVLVEVLERGKNNYLSQYAAQNLSCPPEALHQWLIITNNLNDPDYSTLLPKIQQYLQQQESEQNILLKNAQSKYTNPILSLDL